MDTSCFTSIGAYRFNTRCECSPNWARTAHNSPYGTSSHGENSPARRRRQPVRTRRYRVYTMADLTTPSADHRRLLELPARMSGTRQLDLALAAGPLASSDPTGDQPALRFLDSLLEQAQQHDVTVSLYAHHAVWLESTHDAVRLCRALQHPNLGITLSGYHWYLQPDPSMDRDLPPMAPHLRSVSTQRAPSGTRRRSAGSHPRTTIRRAPAVLRRSPVGSVWPSSSRVE